MKIKLAMVLLLMSPAVFAEVGGYIDGGPTVAFYEFEDSDDFRLEFDTGVGYSLAGGLRFTPGLNLHATYRHVEHRGGDVYFDDDKIDTFDEDLELSDLRIGFHYAPPVEKVVGFRVGAGYVRQTFEIDAPGSDELVTDGGFFEGGLIVKPAQFITLDVGGGLLAMKDDEDGDAFGLEVRGQATFHFGALDLGLGGRWTLVNTEYEDDFDLEEEFGEIRFTIGGSWGYPGVRR
jgi:hypothetical protein